MSMFQKFENIKEVFECVKREHKITLERIRKLKSRQKEIQPSK